ncbi:MAG: amino acid permease, partial [Kiloniellales bacterium]|nr:amino acid permease [Kiloniellales bacterium]
MPLKRSLGFWQLVFYGTGTILGAGIFVVIGEVLREAQTLAPLAYLLAAVVAATSALSFAEMAARIPTAGGPIDYVEQAFGYRWLGSSIGWILIAANTVSAATIVTGFVSYLSTFVPVHSYVATIALVFVLGGVAAAGMKASAWMMTTTTIVGMVTLLAVLWALQDGLAAAPSLVWNATLDVDQAALAGLMGGAFLAVYSFIGFGDMAQTAEEVRDVKRTLPRAMIGALCLVFVFYVAVSAALVGSSSIVEIADAKAPLVTAVALEGWPELPVAVASLFVIVNGALAQIIASSRLLFDIGRDGRGAPLFFASVNPTTHTPLRATAVVVACVLTLALLVPLRELAQTTSLTILLVFIGVNASLFVLKRRSQPADVPTVNIAVPVIGVVSGCAAVLGQLAVLMME